MKCNHNLAEMGTACVDGICPICLREKIEKLEKQRIKLLAKIVFLEDDLKKYGQHDPECRSRSQMWQVGGSINHNVCNCGWWRKMKLLEEI